MNPIVLIIGIAIVVLILIIATISIRGERSGVIEERLGRYTEVGSFMTLAEEDKNWKPKMRQQILIPPLAPSGT